MNPSIVKPGARLDQLIARNLQVGRRKVNPLIARGRIVAGDGSRFDDPRRTVLPHELPLTVLFDGERLSLHDQFHLLLHKPVGCVTAAHDPRLPTTHALVEDAPLFSELRAVGRLDKDTCGLLLFTTDGQALHRLTHPRTRVVRTYQAGLARPHAMPGSALILDDGHRPEITDLRPLTEAELHCALPRPPEAAVYAEISIVGGAYHEVRRIFAALGSHVLSLCRTRFGDHALPPDLAPGSWKPVDL